MSRLYKIYDFHADDGEEDVFINLDAIESIRSINYGYEYKIKMVNGSKYLIDEDCFKGLKNALEESKND